VSDSCYIDAYGYCIPYVDAGNANSDLGISRVRLGAIDNSTQSGTEEYYKDFHTSEYSTWSVDRPIQSV
jgi:hypothetical protein